MAQVQAPVSVELGNFTEGAATFNKNLLWKRNRYVLHTYTTKDGTIVMKRDNSGPATTLALQIDFRDDDGRDMNPQIYSAGDPTKFGPSADGRSIVYIGPELPEGTVAKLQKGSNMNILLSEMVNAGFPANRLADVSKDVSILDGLYAYHVGKDEPKRDGLERAPLAEGQRAKQISVPSKILKLPWDNKKALAAALATPSTGGAAAGAPAAATASATKTKVKGRVISAGSKNGADAKKKAIDLINKLVESAEEGVVTRADVGTKLFAEFANDPDRDAISQIIFGAELSALLEANGLAQDGENIGKAA